MRVKATLAVWKFSSCDGCQLSLLDCEDELLALADQLEISYFLEATSAMGEGPYDVSLVEGSITTPEEEERVREVRARSRTLITIGACATAGGIQALRNFADVEEFTRLVYATPQYITTLATSTPISANVHVDFELQGCPISKEQLLEVISAYLNRRQPRVRAHQRVRGVQAARHGMRDGGARDGVSRADHPGWLRGSVPIVQPRLLRLLRTQGEPEHRVAERVERTRGTRSRTRLPDVQRGGGRVPGSERAP
ncbi:MAG TPA: hypothetical protein VEF89_24115 [Solirubrobacteraceae bacterium]|nr:hypothetical protein [Solirubrobacteraceae bacterium]